MSWWDLHGWSKPRTLWKVRVFLGGCSHPSVGRMLWRGSPFLGLLLTFSNQLLLSQTLGNMDVYGHHRIYLPTGPVPEARGCHWPWATEGDGVSLRHDLAQLHKGGV